MKIVDEDKIRGWCQLIDGGFHCQASGFGNTSAVYYRAGNNADGIRDRSFLYKWKQVLALCPVDKFTVANFTQPAGFQITRENDGGGHHRAGKGAPAHFIHPGHQLVPISEESVLP